MAKFAGVAGGASIAVNALAAAAHVSGTVAAQAIGFVLEQGINLSYVGFETVQSYIHEQQKLDPSWDPKEHQDEINDVVFSDESAMNAVVMLAMSLLTHTVAKGGKKAGKPEERINNEQKETQPKYDERYYEDDAMTDAQIEAAKAREAKRNQRPEVDEGYYEDDAMTDAQIEAAKARATVRQTH